MNVTKGGGENRQLYIEDHLKMVSAEQREYVEVFDYSRHVVIDKLNIYE